MRFGRVMRCHAMTASERRPSASVVRRTRSGESGKKLHRRFEHVGLFAQQRAQQILIGQLVVRRHRQVRQKADARTPRTPDSVSEM